MVIVFLLLLMFLLLVLVGRLVVGGGDMNVVVRELMFQSMVILFVNDGVGVDVDVFYVDAIPPKASH